MSTDEAATPNIERGMRIEFARKAKGLSLSQLAAEIDLSLSQLSRFESGQRRPRADELERIATALDVSILTLLKGEAPTGSDLRIEQGMRLALARKRAGYKSARQAAEFNGWAASTYAAHERGTRTIGQDDAEIYASMFSAGGADLTAKGLLFGDEAKPGQSVGAAVPSLGVSGGGGSRIRAAREQRGLSQSKLAKAIGISQPAIKKIEDGTTEKSKFLPEIERFLGLGIAPSSWLPDREFFIVINVGGEIVRINVVGSGSGWRTLLSSRPDIEIVTIHEIST